MTPEQQAELEQMRQLLLGKMHTPKPEDIEQEIFKGTPEQWEVYQRQRKAIQEFRANMNSSNSQQERTQNDNQPC